MENSTKNKRIINETIPKFGCLIIHMLSVVSSVCTVFSQFSQSLQIFYIILK